MRKGNSYEPRSGEIGRRGTKTEQKKYYLRIEPTPLMASNHLYVTAGAKHSASKKKYTAFLGNKKVKKKSQIMLKIKSNRKNSLPGINLASGRNETLYLFKLCYKNC